MFSINPYTCILDFYIPYFLYILSFRSSIGIIVYIVYLGFNRLVLKGLSSKQCIVYIVYYCLQLGSEFYMQTKFDPFLLKVCQILRPKSEVVIIYTDPHTYVAERVRGDRKEGNEHLSPLRSNLFLYRGESISQLL